MSKCQKCKNECKKYITFFFIKITLKKWKIIQKKE